jgi:hypothetical protein
MTQKLFDTAGMALSFLCLIHCIALPLLLTALPWLASSFTHNEHVHLIFAAFVLPVGVLALASGYRKHHQAWIFFWGLSGLLCIGTAVLAEAQLGETLEHGLSMLGSIQLVLAHYHNLRAQHIHAEGCKH